MVEEEMAKNCCSFLSALPVFAVDLLLVSKMLNQSGQGRFFSLQDILFFTGHHVL